MGDPKPIMPEHDFGVTDTEIETESADEILSDDNPDSIEGDLKILAGEKASEPEREAETQSETQEETQPEPKAEKSDAEILDDLLKALCRHFAVGAIVVEEINDGEIAIWITGHRRIGIVQDHVARDFIVARARPFRDDKDRSGHGRQAQESGARYRIDHVHFSLQG